MSAKSRKRNRRLAALAGLAGAVAFANRKPKQSSTEADSGRGGDTASAKAREDSNKKTTTKKDTTVTTPKTIQDNKSKDTAKKPIPGIRVDKNSITASKYDKDTPNKTFSGPDRKYDYVNRASEKNTAGVAKPKKSLMATVFPKSGAADEFKASTQDYNRGNYKSGGRAKGCGKALRGFGKAMKGNR